MSYHQVLSASRGKTLGEAKQSQASPGLSWPVLRNACAYTTPMAHDSDTSQHQSKSLYMTTLCIPLSKFSLHFVFHLHSSCGGMLVAGLLNVS